MTRCRALSIRAKLSASGVAAADGSADPPYCLSHAAPGVTWLKACLAARIVGVNRESLLAMISISLAKALIAEISSCLLTGAPIAIPGALVEGKRHCHSPGGAVTRCQGSGASLPSQPKLAQHA